MTELKKTLAGEGEKCDTCDKEFEKGEMLRIHVEKDHNALATTTTNSDSDGSLLCKICNENFQSELAIEIHVETNHVRKPDSVTESMAICERIIGEICDLCNKCFVNNNKPIS